MNLSMRQTRVGSTPLLGKVWKSLNGKSQLQHLSERVLLLHGEARFMLVTSFLPQENLLA
jgi:spore coat polysaccharide biosynthesis protein SpsF (cytidylyltransferase family)